MVQLEHILNSSIEYRVVRSWHIIPDRATNEISQRKPGYLFPVNIQLTGLHGIMILRRTTVGGVDILL